MHGHIHSSSIAQVTKGLAKCVEQTLNKVVGVVNQGEVDKIEMTDERAKHNIRWRQTSVSSWSCADIRKRIVSSKLAEAATLFFRATPRWRRSAYRKV